MKVRINPGFAGAGPNGNFKAGDEMPVSDDVGKAWVKAGIATEIVPEKKAKPVKEEKTETADAPKAPETASRKRKGRKVSGRKDK